MKNQKSKVKSQKFQRGQVLLILMMLLATTITIVLTTSLSSTFTTQTSKLEEESQKALAAAEAGIDKTLAENNLNGSTSTNINSISGDFSGLATVSESNSKKTFVSPTLKKDEAYTFYLATYNSQSNVFSNPPYGGPLTIFYETGSSSCLEGALEISLIYGSSPTYQIKRFIADAGNTFGSGNPDNIGLTGGTTVEGTSFNCHTSTIILPSTYTSPKLLIIKAFSLPTKIAIVGNSPLPSQGKTVSSTATSTKTGVTKQVVLFQSYPQIPSDFFVTSF